MKKFMTTLLVYPLVLVACGDNSATTEAVAIDRAPAASTSYPIATKAHFTKELDRIVSGYTIDVILKSNTAIADNEFSKNSPPMPFMTNAFGLYQLDGQYSVYLNSSKKSLLGGSPLEWTRLTIANDGQTTRLYINGEIKADQPDQTALSGQVALGKGISLRYWGGEMKHFNIYEGSIAPAEIDRSPMEVKNKTVMNLDSFLK